MGARNRPSTSRAGTPPFLSLLAPPKREPAELSCVEMGWEGNQTARFPRKELALYRRGEGEEHRGSAAVTERKRDSQPEA